MQAAIKKFQQPGPLADQVAYTIKVMRRTGLSDLEIIAAPKALCEADIEREKKQWQP